MNKNEFKNWLLQRLPSLDQYNAKQTQDLMEGIAGLFSDIHSDITNALDLIDIDAGREEDVLEIVGAGTVSANGIYEFIEDAGIYQKENDLTWTIEYDKASQLWQIIHDDNVMYEGTFESGFNAVNGDIPTPSKQDVFNKTIKYLPHMARTVGIEDEIGIKVPFSVSDLGDDWDNYSSYNFYRRLDQGVQNQREIEVFKRYVKNTIRRNKTKGTLPIIRNLFELFDLDIEIESLWTDDWNPDPDVENDGFSFDVIDYNNEFKFTPDITTTETADIEQIGPNTIKDIEHDLIDGLTRKKFDASDNKVIVMANHPDNESKKIKYGTFLINFIPFRPDSREDKAEFIQDTSDSVQIIFRGRKEFNNIPADLDEYYIAGTNMFGHKLAIVKVTYDQMTDHQYYEIIGKSNENEGLLKEKPYRLSVDVYQNEEEQDVVDVNLIEGAGIASVSEGGQQTEGSEISLNEVNIESPPEEPEKDKKRISGKPYLTRNVYNPIEEAGNYGMRVHDSAVELISYRAKPEDQWPVKYYTKDEIRERFTPYVNDFMGGDLSYYNDQYDEVYTDFFDDIQLDFSLFESNGNCLVSSSAEYTIDTVGNDAYYRGNASNEFYGIADKRQVLFELNTSLKFDSDINETNKEPEAGITFSISDIFDDETGEWKKDKQFYRVVTNKHGFDIVLEKIAIVDTSDEGEPEELQAQSSFISANSVPGGIQPGEWYDIKIRRENTDPMYTELREDPYDNEGNSIKIFVKGPNDSDFHEVIYYDSNEKDAYFDALIDHQRSQGQYSGSTDEETIIDETRIGSVILDYNEAGVMDGIPPIGDNEEEFVNKQVLNKTDSVGDQIALYTMNDAVVFRNVKIQNFDSETHWKYSDIGTYNEKSENLISLEDLEAKNLVRLVESDNTPILGYPHEDDGSEFGRYELETDIDKLEYASGKESPLFSLANGNLFSLRNDSGSFERVIDGVKDFEIFNNHCVAITNEGYVKAFTRNGDMESPVYFKDNQNNYEAYNDYLRRRGLIIRNIYVDDEEDHLYFAVETSTDAGNLTDAMFLGDKLSVSKVTAEGEEIQKEEEIRADTKTFLQKGRLDGAGNIILKEHASHDPLYFDAHLYREFPDLNIRIYVYDDEGRTKFDVLTCDDNEVVFSGDICEENQFKRAFQSYAKKEEFYVFYTSTEEDIDNEATHVYKVDLTDLEVNYGFNKIANELFLYDVIQQQDSFILYGNDVDNFDRLFMIEERDINTVLEYQYSSPLGKIKNVQPFLLPDYKPYDFRKIRSNIGKNEHWFINGKFENIVDEEFIYDQAFDLSQASMRKAFGKPKTPNFQFIFEIKKFPSDSITGTYDQWHDTQNENDWRWRGSGNENNDDIVNEVQWNSTKGFGIFDSESGSFLKLFDIQDKQSLLEVSYQGATTSSSSGPISPKGQIKIRFPVLEKYIDADELSEALELEESILNTHAFISVSGYYEHNENGSDEIIFDVKTDSGQHITKHLATEQYNINDINLNEDLWGTVLSPRNNALIAEINPGHMNARFGACYLLTGQGVKHNSDILIDTINPEKVGEELLSNVQDLSPREDYNKTKQIDFDISTVSQYMPIALRFTEDETDQYPDINFDFIKDGTNILITTERGSDKGVPFVINRLDKNKNILDIMVQPDVLGGPTHSTLYIHYGSDENDRLESQEESTAAFLNKAYSVLSGRVLNSSVHEQSKPGKPFEGIIYHGSSMLPNRYQGRYNQQQRSERYYKLFETNDAPILISFDSNFEKGWHELEELQFYDRGGTYSSQLFNIELLNSNLNEVSNLNEIATMTNQFVERNKPAHTEWKTISPKLLEEYGKDLPDDVFSARLYDKMLEGCIGEKLDYSGLGEFENNIRISDIIRVTKIGIAQVLANPKITITDEFVSSVASLFQVLEEIISITSEFRFEVAGDIYTVDYVESGDPIELASGDNLERPKQSTFITT